MTAAVMDAQVHLWEADTPEHPWLPGRRELAAGKPPAFGPEDLLAEMDAAGVDGAVVVPASFAGWRNDVVAEAALAHPGRFAAMGLVPLDEAHGRPLVEAVGAGEAGLTSLRLTCYLEPQRSQVREGMADWLWPLAEQFDVPLAINAPGMLDLVAAVAERHPGLRLAVDHLGLHSHDRDLPLRPRVAPVLALARCSNVVVKASALVLQSREPYPFRDLHSVVEEVVDVFGPTRVLWGSDLTRLSIPYAQAVSLFTEELTFLDAPALAEVMGGALRRWLRWDPVPSARA